MTSDGAAFAHANTAALRMSLQAWGVYLFCVGASAIIAPNALIETFGFPPIQDNWIRVLGALAFNISIVYFPMARALPKGFVLWSIVSRYTFCGFTILFVLLRWFPPNLLIFG